MSTDTQTEVERAENQPPADEDLSDSNRLAGQLAVLEAENERLRSEYARLRQTQYRRTALALGGLGIAGVLGALLIPTARTVLLALGGTGIFLGVLTYYLSPERFLPATVGRGIYSTLADNERAVVDELGLSDRRVYIPLDERSETRLYTPQTTATSLPEKEALTDLFVVDNRGVSVRPTGDALFAEFERALTGDFSAEPAEITEQLSTGLREQFELVEGTEHSVPADVDREAGEVSIGVTDSVYGPLDQFDHPVVSFLAVGLARGLDTPVEASIETDTDRADAVVICRWQDKDH